MPGKICCDTHRICGNSDYSSWWCKISMHSTFQSFNRSLFMRIAQRISLIITGVALFILLSSAGVVFAGSFDAPGAPDAVSSYTIENICNRLSSGAAGTPVVFTEPTSGPTAGTMHTLNEIMGMAPVADESRSIRRGCAFRQDILGPDLRRMGAASRHPRHQDALCFQ